MKKYGPKRILETKYLYCNKHGDCEHVESGIKVKKWKCCACTVDHSYRYMKKSKLRAVAYLGGSCQVCGYSKSIAALTFHHINPLLKNFNLSGTGLSKSWEKLKPELDKCRLLCCNCHFELHEREDMERIELSEKPQTNYHRKLVHQINAKKLGKNPSL